MGDWVNALLSPLVIVILSLMCVLKWTLICCSSKGELSHGCQSLGSKATKCPLEQVSSFAAPRWGSEQCRLCSGHQGDSSKQGSTPWHWEKCTCSLGQLGSARDMVTVPGEQGQAGDMVMSGGPSDGSGRGWEEVGFVLGNPLSVGRHL